MAQTRDIAGQLAAETHDTTVPAIARVYDAWLGGTENFEADRQLAVKLATMAPGIPDSARENRKFLRRVVRHLAAERGIDQFLDIGSGFPTADNVHQVAQQVNPQATVVYVDNDPIVVARSRELLADNAVTEAVQGDLRDPLAILNDPVVTGTLDFDRPVAILLLAILHFFTDDEAAYSAVAQLTEALPTGGFLVISHMEIVAELAATSSLYAAQAAPFATREAEHIARFFAGVELTEPGLVPVNLWRPEPEVDGRGENVPLLGGIALKAPGGIL
jgi:hypothetical protein